MLPATCCRTCGDWVVIQSHAAEAGPVGGSPSRVAIQQASAACCGAGGDGVLSGGFEAGWHPGMTIEQVAEGVKFADAQFGGGGQVGLDDGEIGESFNGAPGSSGAALLHLDGADCPLGFVVQANRRLHVIGAVRRQRAGCG